MSNQWGSSSSSDEDNAGHMMLLQMHEHYMHCVEAATGTKHGGTSSSRTPVPRDRVGAHERLLSDYFNDSHLYPPHKFYEKFGMRKELFLRILDASIPVDDYFKQKPDATRKLGLTPIVKVTTALRMLMTEGTAHIHDDYLKIGETTCIDSCRRFFRAINKVFGAEYLRKPNKDDLKRFLRKAEARGFPGMLGSVDSMHWQWKNCPMSFHGQFTGHPSRPIVSLEIVASYDTWIWHASFGHPGSLNDKSVLYRSPLFCDYLEGRTPCVRYTINDVEYKRGYYLGDGIYPKWATIVQSYKDPQGPDKQLFIRLQEAYHKDVERAFSILYVKFKIVNMPVRQWYEKDIGAIMKACIILHNIIVEDNREQYGEDYHEDPTPFQVVEPLLEIGRDPITLYEFISNRSNMEDPIAYFALRDDLIAHVWEKHRQGHIN